MRFTFSGIVACGALLAISCLEAPSEPIMGRTSPEIAVVLLVGDSATSRMLAVPGDDLQMQASVSPDSVAEFLDFVWIRKGDTLATGRTTPKIPTQPDSLAIWELELHVTDREGNYAVRTFQLTLDTPPTLTDTAYFQPSTGDTLWASPQEALLFRWNSYDADAYDQLDHFWEVASRTTDSLLISLAVGQAQSLSYGGLEEGDYRYRIRTTDSMGMSDTSAWVPFYVRTTESL